MMSLVKNEVRGCLGCNACRYGKPCIQNDSFNELVPKIKEADCIVFASPLYFWTFEHAAAYYRFIFINYIGFYDRGDASCRRLRAYGWKDAECINKPSKTGISIC